MGDLYAEEADGDELVMKGWLRKRSTFFYRRRWIILSHRYISYYSDEGDEDYINRIYIPKADICKVDDCTFAVTSDSSEKFLIRADSIRERNQWMRALKIVKARATGNFDCNIEEEESDLPTLRRTGGSFRNFLNSIRGGRQQNNPPASKSNLGVEVETN